jgi:hypothetical protein
MSDHPTFSPEQLAAIRAMLVQIEAKLAKLDHLHREMQDMDQSSERGFGPLEPLP